MASLDGEEFEYRLYSERDDDNLTLKNSTRSINKESFLSAQHSTDQEHQERRDSHDITDLIRKKATGEDSDRHFKTPSEFEPHEEVKSSSKRVLKVLGGKALTVQTSGRGHGGPDTPRQVSLNRDEKPIND